MLFRSLREMLEEHGFENVDVDVREQHTNEKHASDDSSELNDIDPPWLLLGTLCS